MGFVDRLSPRVRRTSAVDVGGGGHFCLALDRRAGDSALRAVDPSAGVHLGLHILTDVIAGPIIGAAMVTLLTRAPLRTPFAPRVV